MPDEQTERLREHNDEQIAAAGAETAMQQAAQHQQRTLKNEHFLNELRRADVDSEIFDWLEDEYPSWFSGAHAVSNRGSEWDLSADLIMHSKRERAYAQNNPGRLLEGRPFLRAVAQGADAPGVDAFVDLGMGLARREWARRLSGKTTARDPMTSEERQTTYNAAEVAADLMALSKDGAGLEATTTATTETRVRREEEEETTARRLGSVFE